MRWSPRVNLNVDRINLLAILGPAGPGPGARLWEGEHELELLPNKRQRVLVIVSVFVRWRSISDDTIQSLRQPLAAGRCCKAAASDTV